MILPVRTLPTLNILLCRLSFHHRRTSQQGPGLHNPQLGWGDQVYSPLCTMSFIYVTPFTLNSVSLGLYDVAVQTICGSAYFIHQTH